MYYCAILCDFIQFALSYSVSSVKDTSMSKKNPSTRKVILTSSFAATTALMMAAAALMLSILISNTAIAQQQGMTNATAAKPVDSYNLPQGHLNAVRHNFDDPSLRVEHLQTT
jgi:hypothetical protein